MYNTLYMISGLVRKKKSVIKKNQTKVKDEMVVRKLTTEEKEYMKTAIPKIEDHERQQLFNFIVMDDIKYTKKSDGILLNLTDANDEFTFKIYMFINKCIENQKYRKI